MNLNEILRQIKKWKNHKSEKNLKQGNKQKSPRISWVANNKMVLIHANQPDGCTQPTSLHSNAFFGWLRHFRSNWLLFIEPVEHSHLKQGNKQKSPRISWVANNKMVLIHANQPDGCTQPTSLHSNAFFGWLRHFRSNWLLFIEPVEHSHLLV